MRSDLSKSLASSNVKEQFSQLGFEIFIQYFFVKLEIIYGLLYLLLCTKKVISRSQKNVYFLGNYNLWTPSSSNDFFITFKDFIIGDSKSWPSKYKITILLILQKPFVCITTRTYKSKRFL